MNKRYLYIFVIIFDWIFFVKLGITVAFSSFESDCNFCWTLAGESSLPWWILFCHRPAAYRETEVSVSWRMTFGHQVLWSCQVSSYIDGWGPPPQGELETPLGIGDFVWSSTLRAWFVGIRWIDCWFTLDAFAFNRTVFTYCLFTSFFAKKHLHGILPMNRGWAFGEVPCHSHWPCLWFHSFWATLPGSCCSKDTTVSGEFRSTLLFFLFNCSRGGIRQEERRKGKGFKGAGKAGSASPTTIHIQRQTFKRALEVASFFSIIFSSFFQFSRSSADASSWLKIEDCTRQGKGPVQALQPGEAPVRIC